MTEAPPGWNNGNWDEDAVTDLLCTVVRHTPTRPSLDEKCGYLQNHFGPHSFDELFEDVEDAELEHEEGDIDEESWAKDHWLLIVGIGLVGIGLVIRWWSRQR